MFEESRTMAPSEIALYTILGLIAVLVVVVAWCRCKEPKSGNVYEVESNNKFASPQKATSIFLGSAIKDPAGQYVTSPGPLESKYLTSPGGMAGDQNGWNDSFISSGATKSHEQAQEAEWASHVGSLAKFTDLIGFEEEEAPTEVQDNAVDFPDFGVPADAPASKGFQLSSFQSLRSTDL